jgi:hypothetical protein
MEGVNLGAVFAAITLDTSALRNSANTMASLTKDMNVIDKQKQADIWLSGAWAWMMPASNAWAGCLAA